MGQVIQDKVSTGSMTRARALPPAAIRPYLIHFLESFSSQVRYLGLFLGPLGGLGRHLALLVRHLVAKIPQQWPR